VWCGDRMIVWGGGSPNGVRADGGSFVPPADAAPPTDTGAWTLLPADVAAGARRSHTAIWTGSKMIVWGGLDANGDPLGSGAAFDPANGVWTPLASLLAPAARFGHTAIWTGSKMIIFGGAESELANQGQTFKDGGVYDPVANTWTAL